MMIKSSGNAPGSPSVVIMKVIRAAPKSIVKAESVLLNFSF